MLIVLTSFVLAAIGLVLGGLGTWLVSLGGSWYYLITGIAFLVTGYWVFKRKAEALWLYSAILVGSILWAVWEVGFDWWQLGARGGIIVVLGLWLWTPWIRNKLQGGRIGGTIILSVANVLAIVVAVYSMTQDPQDIAGSLSTEQVATTPDLGANFDDGDWQQYGRTPYGQRYSPLNQITAQNVASLVPAWTYQTGDVKLPEDVGETTYQVTPIKIDDTLYI